MRLWVLVITGLGFLAVGCGPREPVPVSVRGNVKLDGNPLQDGEIHFITAGKVPEIIPIKAGQFEGKALPGQREVHIVAYRPATIPPDVPKSMHALIAQGKENYLPPRYNRKSELKADVTDAGTNEFTFDLSSASK